MPLHVELRGEVIVEKLLKATDLEADRAGPVNCPTASSPFPFWWLFGNASTSKLLEKGDLWPRAHLSDSTFNKINVAAPRVSIMMDFAPKWQRKSGERGKPSNANGATAAYEYASHTFLVFAICA
jgi:hypothetical protein